MDYTVTQLVDITNKIQYNKIVGQKKMLQIVNACASHEMRNPLNSIMCQNQLLTECVRVLVDLIDDSLINDVSTLKRKLRGVVCQMQDSVVIMQSSSKMLNYFVHDMLSLSQLNDDKFRKNISVFDLRTAVHEVMSI